MKKRKKIDFSEYSKNSKKLFKLIFGDVLYKQVKNTPMIPFNWDGVDIHCNDIIKCTYNIKDTYKKNGLDYFKERDYDLLDLYIMSVFHYGYQQKSDNAEDDIFDYKKMSNTDSNTINSIIKIIESFESKNSVLVEENKKLLEEISILKNKK